MKTERTCNKDAAPKEKKKERNLTRLAKQRYVKALTQQSIYPYSCNDEAKKKDKKTRQERLRL
jgi:hypothetical protein